MSDQHLQANPLLNESIEFPAYDLSLGSKRARSYDHALEGGAYSAHNERQLEQMPDEEASANSLVLVTVNDKVHTTRESPEVCGGFVNELQTEISWLREEMKEQDEYNKELLAQIRAQRDRASVRINTQLQEHREQMNAKDVEIQKKDMLIQEKDVEIEKKDKLINEKDAQIAKGMINHWKKFYTIKSLKDDKASLTRGLLAAKDDLIRAQRETVTAQRETLNAYRSAMI